MKRVHMSLALGSVAVLLAFWVVRPGARSWEAESPKASRSAPAPLRPEEKLSTSVSASVPHRAPPPAPSVESPGSSPPAPQVSQASSPAGHWGHWGYLEGIAWGSSELGRLEAIRTTAAYLSIESGSLLAFEDAAWQSIQELEQALAVREQELATLEPAGVSPSVQSESGRQSEGRYAAVRQKALERMERFLCQTPVHQEFRWGFDSWASMVSAKARGIDR
jgi:hypothetical protein